MRVLVCGGRDFDDAGLMNSVLDRLHTEKFFTVLIHGNARGVSIEGKIERLNGSGTFRFVWRETGGPAVTKPTRRGFGSFIHSARHFGQIVELDYSPRGLCYELQVQLNTIEHQTNGWIGAHRHAAGLFLTHFLKLFAS
jgi:hypothetical protein